MCIAVITDRSPRPMSCLLVLPKLYVSAKGSWLVHPDKIYPAVAGQLTINMPEVSNRLGPVRRDRISRISVPQFSHLFFAPNETLVFLEGVPEAPAILDGSLIP